MQPHAVRGGASSLSSRVMRWHRRVGTQHIPANSHSSPMGLLPSALQEGPEAAPPPTGEGSGLPSEQGDAWLLSARREDQMSLVPPNLLTSLHPLTFPPDAAELAASGLYPPSLMGCPRLTGQKPIPKELPSRPITPLPRLAWG